MPFHRVKAKSASGSGGGGGSTTYNQYTVADEFVGPASYATGGMVIDMSKTMSSLNSVDLVVKKGSRGANLPLVRYETTLNSPSAGKATVKIVRKRVNEVTAVSTVSGQPSGVTIRSASAVASAIDQIQLLTDNFSRANNPSSMGVASGTGQTWTSRVGTWGIISNQAYMSSTTFIGHATIPGVFGGQTLLHGKLNVTIQTTVTADRTYRGLVIKWIDSSNYILCVLEDTAGSDRVCTLYKVVAGVFTQLAVTGTAQWVVGAAVNMSIIFLGERIIVYLGGVEKFYYLMTAGEVALFNGSSTVGLFINAGGGVDDNTGLMYAFSGLILHYHSMDHDHGSFASGAPSNTGAAVLLDALGPNHSTHTHTLDLPNYVASSGSGPSHTHEDNSIYQHSHATGQVSTAFISSELPNTTNLSGTTWLLAVTGVKI